MKLKNSILLLSVSLLFNTGCPAPGTTDTTPSETPDSYNQDSGSTTSEAQKNNNSTIAPLPSPSAAATSAPLYPRPYSSTQPSGETVGASSDAAGIAPPRDGGDDLNVNPDGQTFTNYGENPFINTQADTLSTFAIDVDTGSYTLMRSSIENGFLPSKDSVRTEEYVNYFDYKYPAPTDSTFSINLEASNSKFGDENTKLLRVGIKGKDIKVEDRKPAILTFVIDVSGSMNLDNRLGLVKQSLEILLKQLQPNDKVGIVIFGSSAKVVLEHKGIDSEAEILQAIRNLQTQGSTNAEEGLRLGYQLAEKAFKPNYINRVILCSDGVANVGVTGAGGILEKIKQESESGITLSTIGFGMGNYNDTLMEQLADNGDGNYAYVDTIKEAQRVFVENLTGTLQVIAKDVKVQVEFNPDIVNEYRLLGYENRDVADQDFRNDSVDGGEIGAGHSVTALYELKLKEPNNGNLAEVKLRYKDVDKSEQVVEISKNIMTSDLNNDFNNTSESFKLAAAVAEYAEILRNSTFAQNGNLQDVLSLSKSLNSNDKISEFNSLIQKAITIKSKN